MSEKQETISDIIAEMRLGATGDLPFAYRIGRPDRIVEYKTEDGKKYAQRRTVIESVTIDELADRLDAAHRRERGDCAKMREAAVSVYNVLEKLRPFSLHLGDVGRMREFSHLICLAKNRLDAALAAPPRNCDVGTEQEQAQRFLKYCVKQDCEKACPFRDCKNSYECAFAWAQMPYAEGEAR